VKIFAGVDPVTAKAVASNFLPSFDVNANRRVQIAVAGLI
jgi:hypothetical protein